MPCDRSVEFSCNSAFRTSNCQRNCMCQHVVSNGVTFFRILISGKHLIPILDFSRDIACKLVGNERYSSSCVRKRLRLHVKGPNCVGLLHRLLSHAARMRHYHLRAPRRGPGRRPRAETALPGRRCALRLGTARGS